MMHVKTLLLFATIASFSLLSAPVNAAIFTVTSTADEGPGSLRQAMIDANSAPGVDVIEFDIDGPGPFTIVLQSALPGIDDEVTIDGLSQPGAACDTWPATLQIGLDGSNLTGNPAGLALNASNSTIRGLVINGMRDQSSGSGLRIEGNDNRIECNIIGTDSSGSQTSPALRNEYGIIISGGSGNYIGGAAGGSRNLISNNNEHGILLEVGANLNFIQGNFIGTDLSGTNAVPNRGAGIKILDAPGNQVGGADRTAGICDRTCNLISGNADDGIDISGDGGDSTSIQGNFIGTDVLGVQAIENGGNGILIDLRSGLIGTSGHRIGAANAVGSCGAACNLISGNDDWGIRLDDSLIDAVTIQGNYIGTDISGAVALPNADGVKVDGSNHLIGGDQVGQGNVVSGNAGTGIDVQGTRDGEQSSTVQGNLIGVAADGVTPMGNAEDGMRITQSGILIGGLQAGQSNTIAFNGRSGINHSRNVAVAANDSNTISGNAIYANAILGIDLETNGLTGNDPNDADIGANGLQNYPVFDSLPPLTGSGTTVVTGSLDSIASTSFRLEFFANPDCDASGAGQGESFLGHLIVETDSQGDASFDSSLPSPGVPAGQVVTATATRLDSQGNPTDTSEFSQCAEIAGAPVVTTTAETGPGSLAAAIEYSNASNGEDIISFDIDPTSDPNCNAATGVCVLQGNLAPVITGTVIFDGLTQAGADCSQWPPELKITANPQLRFQGNGSVLRGINALAVDLTRTNHTAVCNLIGTNISGTGSADGNTYSGGGMLIEGTGHLVGGLLPTERNLISSTVARSLSINGTDIDVLGNFIGTDVTGTQSLPNRLAGIIVRSSFVFSSGTIRIGNASGTTDGACAGGCNLISGNDGGGIDLRIGNDEPITALIQSNLIGSDVGGEQPLPNQDYGIRVVGDGHVVGGPGSSSGNTVAYNNGPGVAIESFVAGSFSIESFDNRIVTNRIFENAGSGIDLGNDGPTPNDSADLDEGANRLQNSPVLLSVAADDQAQLEVEFFVDSAPLASAYPLTVQLFVADASGDSGRQPIGTLSYPETAAGSTVTLTLFDQTSPVLDGDLIVATATDLNGNTSEFSAAVSAVGNANDRVFSDRFIEN